MYEISGKVALVTGALGGIGREYVQALLKEDVKGISLIDIVSNEVAQEFLDKLNKEFGKDKVIYVKCDITKDDQIKDAFETTLKKFNQLDIVINNAGVVDEIDVINTLNINLVATIKITYLAIQEYFPKYKKADEGIVLNTASLAGLMPLYMSPVYTATKHGVVAFGQSLANPQYYAKYKTKVLTICPGMTQTPIFQCAKPTPELIEASKDLAKFLENPSLKLQTPDSVAKIMIEMIKEAENGAVWISRLDSPAIKYDPKVNLKHVFGLIGLENLL